MQASEIKTSTILLSLFTIAIAISLYLEFREIGDISILCYQAQSLLSGKTLYKDVVETNPPLAILLYTPFVFIAEKLGLHSGNTIRFIGIILSVIFSIWAAKLLPKKEEYQKNREPLFLLFLGALLLVPNASGDLAQREHLLMILCLPYFVRMLPSNESIIGKWHSIAVGIFAGIGFCLKPYFMLIYVAAALGRNFLRREKIAQYNTETITVIYVGLFYALITAIFFPEFFEQLRFIADAYRGYFLVPNFLASRLVYPLYVILVAVYLAKPLQNKDLSFLAVIVAAVTIEILLQFKPWGYITLPLFITTSILIGIGSVLEKQKFDRFAGSAIMLFVIFFSLPLSAHDGYKQMYKEADEHKALLEELKKKGVHNIFSFSESYGYNFPNVLDAGLNWSSRYAHLWMFRTIYGDATINPSVKPVRGKEQLSSRIYSDIKNDFRNTPPDALMFDVTKSTGTFPQTYDYKQWMNNDEELSNLLNNFIFFKTLNLCSDKPNAYVTLCRFDFFIRKDISTPQNTL